MAVTLFNNAQILIGAYDASADSNEVKLEQKADMLPNKTFGSTTNTFQAGLRSLDIEGKGLIQFDSSSTPTKVDDQLDALIGGASSSPFTIAVDTADGSVTYLGKLNEAQWTRDLKNTELGKFEFKDRPGHQWTRGTLIVPLVSRTATTTGTIYQLGALSATQRLLANLHVTAFNGTSLDVVIKSNDTNNTTTPTTALTFTQATGVTSQFLQGAVGAITDTYYYAVMTFVGTSFSCAVSLGIK